MQAFRHRISNTDSVREQSSYSFLSFERARKTGTTSKRFDPGPDGYLTPAVDDSPTKRFGRHVEGAKIHRHPTPGPVDSEWLYGHNWVCLAVLMAHPLWGVIALPLLSMLYVRQCDVAALDAEYGWEFQTKHELAFRMIKQVSSWLRVLGSQAKLLVAFDGA